MFFIHIKPRNMIMIVSFPYILALLQLDPGATFSYIIQTGDVTWALKLYGLNLTESAIYVYNLLQYFWPFSNVQCMITGFL